MGVVDERSEIGGCYLGVPQNDLGIRTDVLDLTAHPGDDAVCVHVSLVIADELGDPGDIHAVEAVRNCGCCLLATVHEIQWKISGKNLWRLTADISLKDVVLL